MKTVGFIVIGLVVFLLAVLAWFWTPDQPREALVAKYLRSPDDMLDVGGVQLHVRDDGPSNAPAVIMLHGFGSSLHTWEVWSQGLKDKFRVIRLDLPGSGLSPPDPSGIYTDARTINLLLTLMDQLGIQKASLIGNSIGGRIAWTMAAQHPELVTSLVLISPDGFASPGFEYGKAASVPGMMEVMRYVLPKFLVRANLAPSYGDASKLSEATLNRYYDLMLAPGGRAALLARLKQTLLINPEPVLSQIRAPALLVWGKKDQLIPFTNVSDYQRILHDSQLVAFPDLGHVPQEENPAESLPPVRTFLINTTEKQDATTHALTNDEMSVVSKK